MLQSYFKYFSNQSRFACIAAIWSFGSLGRRVVWVKRSFASERLATLDAALKRFVLVMIIDVM